jgi:hypothetical protein
MQSNMNAVFWMVMSDVEGRSPPRVRHADYEIAKGEAKRLALRNPGEKFFVLAAVAVAHTPEPVVFEKLHMRDSIEDEIPF